MDVIFVKVIFCKRTYDQTIFYFFALSVFEVNTGGNIADTCVRKERKGKREREKTERGVEEKCHILFLSRRSCV